jgi:PAS domain S-box-containing protein
LQIRVCSQALKKVLRMNESAGRPPQKPDIPQEIQTRWQRIVDLMARTAGVAAALIMRADPPRIEVFVSSSTEGNPYRKGESEDLDAGLYCETVMEERAPLLVPDARKDPQWDHNPDIARGMTFYLGYPLKWSDGVVFGTICVLDDKNNLQAIEFRGLIAEFQKLVERDLRLIVEIREREALLAELQRQRDKLEEALADLGKNRQELKERFRFEELISGISANFADLPPDSAPAEMALALKRICSFFGKEHCGLLEVLADRRQIEPVSIYHEQGVSQEPLNVLAADRHPWAYHRLVEQKEPVFFSSLESLPPEARVDRSHWAQDGVQAMLMLPLHPGVRVSHLIGLWSDRPAEQWPTSHINCLSFLGEVLAKGHLHIHADKALQISEWELAEAQRVAHVGSWYWDIIAGTHHWSDEFYRIFGLPPQERDANYELFLAAVHSRDRQRVDRANQEAISDTEKPYSIEYRVVRPDGTERVVHARAEIHFDQERRPLRMIGVLQDITECKHAEESLQKALQEIRKLKEQLEAENIYLRKNMESKVGITDIVGVSDPIKYVMYRIKQVAAAPTTVLLTGETGSGKGVFARTLHKASNRKDKPFVHVNCAGLPPNLIESELFGRERGAFTGSTARQIGRFELAAGGSIFLDEIGELPLKLQAKLLKVIEDGEFERLGNPHPVKVDVRIIASTNRNLEQEIEKNRFRKDLFYRLNVFPVTIPPLRQRREDIPLLVKFFAEKFGRAHGKRIKKIPKQTMKALENYEWPGNVRELMNIIERAVIVCEGPELVLAEKIDEFACADPEATAAGGKKTGARGLSEVEREYILTTLQETGWQIEGEKGAATRIGLKPSTLRARMKKLGIQRPQVR